MATILTILVHEASATIARNLVNRTMSAIESLLSRPSSEIDLCPSKIYRQDLQPAIAKVPNDYLRASLYLLNDDIHNAHEISGAKEGDEGLNLIHSILHRREGDFWNSCWWTSRVTHPVLMDLWAQGSGDINVARENAKSYVNRVEAWQKGESKKASEEKELKDIQHHELVTLVKHFSE